MFSFPVILILVSVAGNGKIIIECVDYRVYIIISMLILSHVSTCDN